MVPISDNVPITAGAGTNIATDDVGGVHYQRNKIDLGGDGVSSPLVRGAQTSANSLPVVLASDQASHPVTLAAGTAFAAKIQLTDGTSDATVRNLAANDALNVAIVDGAGNQVTSFGGSGGTSATDDAAYTAGSGSGTPMMGFATSDLVDPGDVGVLAMTTARSVNVNVAESALDVAHDAADANNPVKTGARAVNALPTAVANNDRANNISDLFGRLLTSHIDPGMQVWKSFNATTTQTGAVVWDPAAGKKIAITHLQVTTYATTAARVILFFNTTTTYTEGTHQPVFKGSFAPSSTVKPGALPPITYPIFSATADAELRITTDAGISVDVVVYGYEF